MTRTATVEASYQAQIAAAHERFADHEDMDGARILNWLLQFDDPDLPLGVRILEAVRYVKGSDIRSMSRDLFAMVRDELARQGLNRAAFVAAGTPGSGSGTVARVLRESIRGSSHANMSMWHLATAAPGSLDAVVFFDDFSGTGQTLKDWWATVEASVRPITTDVYVGLLIATNRARRAVEDFAQVLAVSELAPRENALANDSDLLTAKEKARTRDYCARTGTQAIYHEGYGGCALLLAFKHGCPDNSLPILWADTAAWRPLFSRSAI
jgi:hypothetical protein